MAITSNDQFEAYLRSSDYAFTSISPLSGSFTNYVWRITAPPVPPPSASTLSSFTSEAEALSAIPSLLPTSSDSARLPTALHHDTTKHVLLLEDVGQRTLKEAYTDATLDVGAAGARIGAWLAGLHSSTSRTRIGDDSAAKEMYRYCYANLAGAMSEAGLDPAFGRVVNESDGEAEPVGLAVVDWETVRRGSGPTEVGQFAGSAYCPDWFRGGKGLCVAFLAAYRGDRMLDRNFVKRVAVHFGTHLGEKEERREVMELGMDVARRADDEDWGWLEQTVLKPLLT